MCGYKTLIYVALPLLSTIVHYCTCMLLTLYNNSVIICSEILNLDKNCYFHYINYNLYFLNLITYF